jgi:hypothetical protein
MFPAGATAEIGTGNQDRRSAIVCPVEQIVRVLAQRDGMITSVSTLAAPNGTARPVMVEMACMAVPLGEAVH